ncbi:MAG: hypothetical protein WBQ73_02755 [Candidatus Babeliales bacterium]
MNLVFISPKKTADFSVLWLEITTRINEHILGNRVIKDEHAPALFVLAPNTPLLFCLLDGKIETYSSSALGGIVHIQERNKVLVYLNNLPS